MLRLPGCAAAAFIVILSASVVHAAPAKASVGALEGRAMVQRADGPATEVLEGAEFGVGDLITVMQDSRLEVDCGNGSFLSIEEGSEVRLLQLDKKGTQVALISGLINVARSGNVPLTIHTEYSVKLDVVDSTGYAEVVIGDRMKFANRKGEGVTLFLLDEERPLEAGDLPFLIDLKKLDLVRKPVQVATGPHMNFGTGELLSTQGAYLLDRRVIRVYPPDKVTVERMSDGGLRLTGAGLGDNEYVRVEVGYEAVLYLANGEVVVLDKHGNVDEFTGRTFVERPLDPRAFDWEPVKDAADSSTIRTRAR
jgi:hypothetical protein